MTSTTTPAVEQLVTFAARRADIAAEGYSLSGNDRAACGSPDSLTSPGAEMLKSVRNATLEAFDSFVESTLDGFDSAIDETLDASEFDYDAFDYNGTAHEIADGGPDVYTHAAWAQFVDLAAYEEDLGEYGDVDPTNLTQSVAMRSLYCIAERLVRSIVDELAAAIETDLDDIAAAAEDEQSDDDLTEG